MYSGGDGQPHGAATHLTDCAFAARFLHLKQEHTDKAIPLLEQAARDYRELGRYFRKHGLTMTLTLPITISKMSQTV